MGAQQWVQLVGYLAWPLAAVGIAFAFREAIGGFIGSLGGRLTKLSVFSVSVELTPAAPAGGTGFLGEVRSVANPAEINDSSRTMLDQVELTQPADYAVIDLGMGNEWLTSRLYVAAIMLKRMRGVRAFVFIGEEGGVKRRVLAVASADELRWLLAKRFPALELAWQIALAGQFPPMRYSTSPFITSASGAFDPMIARMITSNFIGILQQGPLKSPNASDWTVFDKPRGERGVWVTQELLQQLLPSCAFSAWAPAFRDASPGKLARAVLRRSGDVIALVNDDRSFDFAVSRRTLLEEAVSELAKEPAD